MNRVLIGFFRLRHNVADAVCQEYELAIAEYRACVESFSARDPEGMGKLVAARERKDRVAGLGWGMLGE